VTRLDECVAVMGTDGLDALVLGRDCHVRALTGERRLWLAGTRQFTPAAVVVRSTASVFVPPMTWNPAHLAELLRAVPGLPDAARVGVDGMTPGAHALLGSVLPTATFVDATPLLRTLLRVKTADEIAGIRAAAAVAVDALAAMRSVTNPRATAAARRAAFIERAAAAGVTTPAFEAVTTELTFGGSTWCSSPGPIASAGPVAFRGGVLRDGWEASLARTDRDGREQTPAGWDGAVAACRPGARVGDLPVPHGVGRGIEPLAPDVTLEPGMVVAVEVADAGALRQDVVLVGADGPEVLTA
jgi:Xaa-Pro aminopeptidase